MFAAISVGTVVDNAFLSDVVGNCNTDHCSWEPYYSIGVCTAVEDLTATILKSNDTQYPVTIPDTRIQGPNQNGAMTESLWVQTVIPDTLTQPNTNLSGEAEISKIGEIFAMYFPPHNGTSNYGDTSGSLIDPRNWKAHKVTLSLCLQLLN